MQTVQDILAGRQAYRVAATWPVKRVVAYLCEKRVGAVPVLDADEIVGVFSERDLMKRVVCEGRDVETTPVDEVMTRDIVTIAPDATYVEAKSAMVKHGIRHLVVKDEQGRLKGFVSLRELSELALRDAESLVSKLNDDYYNMPGRGTEE